LVWLLPGRGCAKTCQVSEEFFFFTESVKEGGKHHVIFQASRPPG
jgi:hypothetical protein